MNSSITRLGLFVCVLFSYIACDDNPKAVSQPMISLNYSRLSLMDMLARVSTMFESSGAILNKTTALTSAALLTEFDVATSELPTQQVKDVDL